MNVVGNEFGMPRTSEIRSERNELEVPACQISASNEAFPGLPKNNPGSIDGSFRRNRAKCKMKQAKVSQRKQSIKRAETCAKNDMSISPIRYSIRSPDRVKSGIKAVS